MNPRIIEVLSILSGLAGRVKADRATCGLNPQIDALLPGIRLIVRRRAYLHHGIYVGDGRVIHYAGWFHSALGLVEEVTIKQFTEGRRYSIGRTPANPEKGEQVVRRARSRLGERCYHLLKNNCEHFCNWCQLGEWRSEQVEALARPTLLLFGLLRSLRSELLARLFRFRDDVPKVTWVTARTGGIMKTAALVMLFMVGVSRVGTGVAAPLSDLATASLRNTHATKGFGGVRPAR
jgi:Lecithin retinol acyltransferase